MLNPSHFVCGFTFFFIISSSHTWVYNMRSWRQGFFFYTLRNPLMKYDSGNSLSTWVSWVVACTCHVIMPWLQSDFWKWMKLISPQKRKIAFWHKSVLDKQSRCRCRWLMTAILFSISYLPLSSVICHEWWSKSCFCSFTEFASRYRVTEREDQDHFGTVRHSRCAVRQTFKTEEIKTSSSSKVFSATVRWKNHRRTLALFVASIIRVAVLSWTVHPP
mgnify:CR=1 FL=1